MKRQFWMVIIGFMLFVAGCGDGDDKPDRASPTPPVPASPTIIMAAPTQTPGGPTLTPSVTVPPTITPTNTAPPAPPTGTATPTETPGPHEYTVQAGDTCWTIAVHFGHVDPPIVGEIERLNGIQCRSLVAGRTILVPRPTFTPTPVGADLTQTVVATSAPPMVALNVSSSISVQPYTIEQDDTLSSIAILADSSLRQLCELNPLPDGLDCSGCVWESPHCCCPRPPLMVPGKQIFVPAPSPTPTLTPTFTGSETPTMTPTHRAPQPIYPAEGANIAGPVRFMWLTAGVLAADEYYLVNVREETTGATFTGETRQLSLDLPQEYLPADGQARTFVWQVSVARLGSDGLLYPAGGVVPEQKFLWRGWE